MTRFGTFWKSILAGGAGVVTLAAVNSKIRRNATEPDDSALGGEARFFHWKHGRIYYKVAGEDRPGPPVIFVHGIGAGASSFMWRKNFDPLADTFQVFAFDLLGFGFSDRPSAAPYSADLYVDLISDFIKQVVGPPVYLVASSLSAAYAIRIAAEHPDLIKAMILNSPAGSDTLSQRPGMAGAAFYGLLQSPVLGTSFYNVMASERSIREYASKYLFYDSARVTDRLVAHLYATSHQQGSQHAIAAFLSGYLNTDARAALSRLTQSVLLVWGREDSINSIQHGEKLMQLNPRARIEVFERCRMMPEQEHPEKFNQLVRDTFQYQIIDTSSHL